MSRTRRAASRIVGWIQCCLGVLASVFILLIYVDQSVRDALSITSEEVNLYMFIFMVFSVLSILSGLLLARDRR